MLAVILGLRGSAPNRNESAKVSTWRTSFLKAGATHIIWVTDPQFSNRDVQNIESDLIELLDPSANKKRPVPPTSLQQQTHTVVGHFRRLVHNERKRRYLLRIMAL